jgi:hypothetical protein
MTALKREATIRWLGNPPDRTPRLMIPRRRLDGATQHATL